MVQPYLFIPSLCLCPLVAILMICLLQSRSEKGHVCCAAALNTHCASLTGRMLVKLTEGVTHQQRLTGFLSE